MGFPQSLSYFKVFKFLLGETAVTDRADWNTVKVWMQLLYEQGFYPLLMILFLVLTNTNFKLKWEKNKQIKLN